MKECLEELMDKHALNSFELNSDLHATSFYFFFFPILKPFEWKFIMFLLLLFIFKGKIVFGISD